MNFRTSITALLVLLPLILSNSSPVLGAESSGPKWLQLLKSASELSGKRNFDSAYVVAREAVDSAVAANGRNDTSVAMTMHRLSGIAMELKLPETDSLLTATLAVWNQCPNANPLEMAKTLSNYGLALFNGGSYSTADTIYGRCLEIRERYLPPVHLDIVRILLKLGECRVHQSRPAEARGMYQRAIDLCLQLPKSPDSQLAGAYHGLSLAYFVMGANSDAADASRRSVQFAVAAKLLDQQVISMSHLVSIYTAMDSLELADSVSTVALTLLGYPDKTPSSAKDRAALDNLLNNRGQLLWRTRRYVEAESCYVQSLRIKAANQSSESEFVRTNYNLANLYRDLGEYTKAESIYVAVLQQRRQLQKGAHRDVAYSLESYARLLAATGQENSAFDSAAVACEMRREIIEREKERMSEGELLAASRALRTSAALCLSIASRSNSLLDSRSPVLGDILLRTKGFVSDFIFSRTHQELISASTRGDILRPIRERLDRDGTLIEYYLYFREDLSRDTAKTRQGACYASISFGKAGKIEICDLGFVAPIDSIVTQYRDHLRAVSSQGHMPTKEQYREYVSIARRLHKAVFAPIKGIAQGVPLLIAPDGMLNLIPFATLIDGKGHYLTEKHPIHYLSAGRDLIRDVGMPATGTLLAFGDPDFDAKPEDRFSPPQAAAIGTMVSRRPTSVRSMDSDCDQMKSFHVSRLPYTKNEIDAVAAVWKIAGRSDARILIGPAASEDQFRRLAPDASVIYVATHGFYFGEKCDTVAGSESSSMLESVSQLQTGGLLFAGANLNGQGVLEAGVEDGIVTTAEIAELNLQRTSLVILSACETGLGRLMTGEGVYGLRRAFLLAGAKTVVSSLWKIDDSNTAEMMAGLFADQSSSISDRIRAVQLAQIKKLRDSGLGDHPYSWGAFVATGALR